MSKYCAVENQSSVMFNPGERFHRMTKRSASRYGKGRNNNALIMLKMDVFAPIPMASDKIAANVNPGLLARVRTACPKSLAKVFMCQPTPYPAEMETATLD